MLMKGLSRFVNSIGKMNLVDALEPSSLSVSKYWRLRVLESMFCATS